MLFERIEAAGDHGNRIVGAREVSVAAKPCVIRDFEMKHGDLAWRAARLALDAQRSQWLASLDTIELSDLDLRQVTVVREPIELLVPQTNTICTPTVMGENRLNETLRRS